MQQSLMCKYWTPHIRTVLTYIDALTTIEKDTGHCLLHYILCEKHIDDMSINLVLDGYKTRYADSEGAALAVLVCEEMLAMTTYQRLMLSMPNYHGVGRYGSCLYGHACSWCELYRMAKESEEKK